MNLNAWPREFITVIFCWLISFIFLPIYGEEVKSVDELIQVELISDYDTYSEGIKSWLGVKVGGTQVAYLLEKFW